MKPSVEPDRRAKASLPQAPVLVLGYGNELRGDDAVGPRAAQAVADWGLAGVTVHSLPQLFPELAESMAAARAVLFLDAARSPIEGPAQAVRLRPDKHAALAPHVSDPRALLALARSLYGRAPEAWLIRIPAGTFELGARLSPKAEAGLAEALPLARKLLERLGVSVGPG